jgi:hypothetical protein
MSSSAIHWPAPDIHNILQIPNPFMEIEDIKIDPNDVEMASATAESFHFHIFQERLYSNKFIVEEYLANTLWDNKMLRVPETLDNWPPSVIWDYWYGVAALLCWGSPEKLIPALRRLYYEGEAADGTYEPDGNAGDSSESGTQDDDGEDEDESDECESEGTIFPCDAMDIIGLLWYSSSVKRDQQRVSKWVMLMG